MDYVNTRELEKKDSDTYTHTHTHSDIYIYSQILNLFPLQSKLKQKTHIH